MTSPPWDRAFWEIPLGSPPEVLGIAKNLHGFDPVDLYCLPNLWSLHLYCYTGLLIVEGRELPIRPGYVGVTPPGMQMEYRYVGLSAHIFVHFRLPNDAPARRAVRHIRAMQDLGGAFDALYARLEAVVGADPEKRIRAASRVWEALWDLSDTGEGQASGPAVPPLVRRVANEIEQRLSEPLTVAGLAEDAGVSSGYLVRLFRETYDETVTGYLRKRRVERAVHLLQRSTLPVKVIAASVGIPDLQHFNKVIRQGTGLSPRALRDV